jgi:hypothetical protein
LATSSFERELKKALTDFEDSNVKVISLIGKDPISINVALN